MAEVGILNLEIRDNSYEAGTHLASLAGVLRTIKEVAPGNELGSVARALKKINESISTKTPGVLNGIGRALEKIKAASNFELPNLQGLKSVMKYMQSLEKSAGGLSDATRQAMAGMGEQTETVRGSLETLGSNIAQVTEQFRDMQSAMNDGSQSNIGLIFSGFDPSMIQLDAFRMTMEQFRQGAQEMTQLGDMVRNSFESIRDTITSGFTQGMNETMEIFRLTMDDISGYTEQTANKIIGSLDGMYEKFRFILNEWLSMRSSMTLGDGKEGFAALGPGMELSTNVEKGWTSWKDGAIEVEGTVTDAMERIEGSIGDIQPKLMGMTESEQEIADHAKEYTAQIAEASRRMDELNAKTNRQNIMYNHMLAEQLRGAEKTFESIYNGVSFRSAALRGELGEGAQKNAITTTAEDLKMTVAEVKAKIEEMKASMSGATPEVQKFAEAMGKVSNGSVTADISKDMNLDDLSLARAQLNAYTQATSEAVQAGKLSEQQYLACIAKAKKYAAQVEKLEKAQENAKNSTKSLGDRFRELKGSISKMFPTLSGLLNRFKSLVKYRMLRTVLKHISEGFQEGVENVYHYSKAIGSSFYKSMDNASAALLQMKNSIGAAVAPAIQALIPLLQSVVNWFIQGVNWINQFFALLAGQRTWTRALLATTSAYDDQTKAAKKAGAAVKDLLADWDELNIIQSNSAGGGAGAGTSAAEDYLKMFEEVSVFDHKVKDIVKFLQENMKEIYTIAIAIGASMLAWKFSKAFNTILPVLSGLVGTVIPIALTITATALLDNKFLETGNPGYLVTGFLTSLLGSYISGRVAESIIGKGAGKYAFALTLIANAITDVVVDIGNTDVTALDMKSIGLNAKAAVESGIAAGYLAYEVGGATKGVAAGVGGLAAVATFAAAIGIKAFTDEMHTDMTGVNTGTIKNALISAAGIGTSLTAIGMMFGLPLLIGPAGAIVTFAALIGIKAALSAEAAQWGDVKLTEKQVTAFVKGQMLNIDADVAINKIHATVENLDADKTDIETKLTDVLGTFKVIQMGIADNQDYEQLKTDVDSLVETVQSYADDAKKAGKLVLQFVPKLVGENEGDQSEWYKNYTSGWDTVNEYIKGKGAEIGSLFVEGANGEIILKEPETLQTLMQYMNDVTEAMTKAKINSEAEMEFRIGLSDLTEKSYGEVVNKFADYKTKLKAEYQSLVDSMYINQSQLTAALYQIYVQTGTAEAEAEWKAAQEQLDKMKENLGTAADDMVKEASMGGAEALITFLREKYQTAITALNKDFESGLGYLEFFSDGGKTAEEMNQHIIEMLRPNNATLAKSLADTGLSGWNVLTDEIKAQVREAMIAGFGIDVTDEIIRMWESELPETMREADQVLENNEPAPQIKANKFYQGLDGMIEKTKNTVQTIMDMLSNLNTNVTVSTDVRVGGGGRWWGSSDEVQMRANGGPIRSGDLIMANENGQIEMMGKMGRDPVVANNQQIVEGITSGVTNANGDVVAALNTLIQLAQRQANKSMKFNVGGSTFGRAVAVGNDSYSRVTG